jgi:hypothetical protein
MTEPNKQEFVSASKDANKQPPAEAGEAGEGAVAWAREWEGDDSDLGQFCVVFNEDEKDDNPNWFTLYTSQTTATQAAVAAAMRRCSELVRTQVVWNESVAPDCFADAILASIPAEATAALRELIEEAVSKGFDIGLRYQGCLENNAADADIAILRDLEIVRLREALGELLTLEYAKEQLGYLRKGIGTATKDRVWLDAESALSTPIDLSALARHDEEIVGPWKMDAERLRQFTIWADAGLAPCLVYDDDGHWSVSFEGISEDSVEGWQTSWVQSRVDEWHDSPEDAIDSAIDATKGEKK